MIRPPADPRGRQLSAEECLAEVGVIERGLCVGKRHMGKTHHLYCATLNLINSGRVAVGIIWQPKGPREGWRAFPWATHVDTVRDIATAPPSVIYCVNREDPELCARLALELRPSVLVLDELIDERICRGQTWVAPTVSEILFRGVDIACLANTQRLAKVPVDLPSMADWLWIFRTTGRNDLKRLSDEGVPDQVISQLPSYPPHKYFSHEL